MVIVQDRYVKGETTKGEDDWQILHNVKVGSFSSMSPEAYTQGPIDKTKEEKENVRRVNLY